MTYEGVVSAARSRASSASSLENPSACRYPMTWVSPSARTLPGPLAMAVLRDAHNASRIGLGLLVLKGCGPLFLGAWRHPLRRRLLVCGFTVVGLLHCLAMVRTGLLVPSAADPGPGRALGLPQRCANFTISLLRGRLEPKHLSPTGGADGAALPAPGRTRLAVRPGAHVSPLVSGS